MTRLLVVLLAVLSLTVAACGSSGKDNAKATTTTTSATSAAPPATTTQQTPAAGACKPVKAQTAVKRASKKPTTTLSASKTYVVTLKTSCGDIQITLDTKGNPKTASSFASLVQSGFYDGLGVVRVVPGFVLQAGDPNGDGSGGPSYSVVEPPGNNAAYRKGVVAMAKTGAEAPGTSGSQFFIVTGADAGLPPDYAIAGKVTKGQDVADTIGAIPPQGGQDGPPTEPVIIEKA
ncbi:MAG: peptidyl-prolyl cis-trans isomerase cyclophilin type, partial [Frankiales bacterium]|nr:peptidyl-prolyl cis-trans isomerase cyclophilin type [Frankiales bacterium]